MHKKCFLLACLALFQHTANAGAHEYWVEPEQYVLPEPGAVTGNLKNGQNFKSGNFSYIPSRFDFFKITGPGGETDIEGRTGDMPALNAEVSAPGLYSISYQGKFDKLVFHNAEKIEEYITYEGFKGVLERHKERGLAADRFEEKYARCAKALIQVGSADPDGRQDGLTGMKFELVAEKNPYALQNGDTLPVRLYWEGEPMADVQIRIFRFDGELENTTTRTDSEGRAMIPLKTGGKFMLNAVHLYEGDDDPDNETPEWFSYWASMVFGTAGTDEILQNSAKAK